ncbi:MAG: flagellar hook-length control protein FliK, partial [Candidatus Kapabacteria bacterium]|nr:flagellar hook-length control protein FliK [Candidatus Kapabacteria bacterium]
GTNVDFSLSEAKSEARVNSAERFDALDKSGTLRTDDVPRYVSKTISQMSDGTTHEATLNLSPETLGKINIKISVSGDTAKILFKVDNSETLKAIENQIGSLKESLQSSGIRVESVGVEQGSTDLLNSDEQRNDAGENSRKEDEAVRREYLEYVRSNVSDTDLEHSFASFAEQVNISPDEFKELAPQLAEGDEVYGKQFNRKI